MNLSQITLMARIFVILEHASRSLEVCRINDLLANESWRGKRWHPGGVSRQRTTQLLRRMEAWGLTRRTNFGWEVARNASDVARFHELIFTLRSGDVGLTKLKISSSDVDREAR